MSPFWVLESPPTPSAAANSSREPVNSFAFNQPPCIKLGGFSGPDVRIANGQLPEFQQVTLKVLRWEEREKRLVIKDAELVS